MPFCCVLEDEATAEDVCPAAQQAYGEVVCANVDEEDCPAAQHGALVSTKVVDEDQGEEQHPAEKVDSLASPADVCPTMPRKSEESSSRINGTTLLFLQTFCSDAESTCRQILRLIGYVAMFVASMALVVLWAYIFFPFQKPEMGFWANWVFNFVAHPVANYIVALGVLGWFARQIVWDLESRPSLPKTERSRIKRQIQKDLHLAPIGDSLWCIFEHILFSFANIYPIPFSVPLSCIPGAFFSMGLFWRLLSKEVRVLQSTYRFLGFTFCAWTGFCTFFAGMLFYTAFFGQFDMGMQLVLSFAVSAIEFVVVKVIQKLGNCCDVPLHILRELRTCIKLPVIIFKASVLSEAKGFWVFLSMVLPEVLQVGFTVLGVLFEVMLSKTQSSKKIRASFTRVRSSQHFVEKCRFSYGGFKSVQQRLKHMIQTCKATSKEDVEQMAYTWEKEDLDLLNEISSSLTAVVMLELCEVMAPVIYMSLLLCLRSNSFLAHNTPYFPSLANANLRESLIANGYSLLLEASLLLLTEVCARAVIGISFFRFTGAVLRSDFRFWLRTLSMAYIAWLTVVVQHTGHDLTFQFSWLS